MNKPNKNDFSLSRKFTEIKLIIVLLRYLVLIICILPIFFSSIAFAAKPQVGTIAPSSGSSIPGQQVNFIATYFDLDGWTNIMDAYLLINTSSSNKKNCFYGYYSQNTNKLYLRSDNDRQWLGGYSPGSSNIIENSYARLNCSQTTVTGNGNTLAVTWAVTFKQSFMGAKNSYLYVKDDSGSNSGWKQKGTWTIISYNPPVITQLIPLNNSTFLEGDAINIVVQAQGSQPLSYRYLVNATVIQDWTNSNAYTWQTQRGDLKQKTITVEVKDSYQTVVSQDTRVFLFRKPPKP